MKDTYSQMFDNKNAIKMFDAVKVDIYEHGTTGPKRLRYCNAKVYETPKYYILQSYWSTVAAIDKESKQGVDVLRAVYGYTATSAQHIRKFFDDYGALSVITWRPIN